MSITTLILKYSISSASVLFLEQDIHQIFIQFQTASRAGEGEFRQRGQVPWIFSHASIHSVWKQCSHSGMHLTVSLLAYSDKQIGHTISLTPGNLLLSPSSTFLYDSIVDSSRPAVTVAPLVWAAAIATSRRLQEVNLSEVQTPIAIQVAKIMTGPKMARLIILSTCNSVLLWPAKITFS